MNEGMKDSVIKWIGAIPDSWSLVRMKSYSYMKGRIGWQGLTADEFIEEGPFLITGTDFENGKVIWDRSYHISEKRYSEAPQIQIKIGDLLLTKDGTIGKLAYIDEMPGKASLNSHLLVIRPLLNKYTNRFLYWVFSSAVFQGYYEVVSYGSTMNSLSQEQVGDFKFFVPSITEQETIADYLDTHCAELDSIIADLEKQIETLQKYKKSLITETVTKGLDKTVPMKDSGIEWIGQIPQTWSSKRLRYVASVKTGPFGTQLSADEYVDGGIPIVNVKNIGYGRIIADNLDSVPREVVERLRAHKLKENDIVFGRKGAVDKHAIITKEYAGWLQGSDCMRIRIPNGVDAHFLNYFFDSEYFACYVLTYAVGTTMSSMNSEILLNAKLILPPIKEQESIARYLDMECAKIEERIVGKEAQLEIVRRYKQSLIFEYVTGKKRVKEAI